MEDLAELLRQCEPEREKIEGALGRRIVDHDWRRLVSQGDVKPEMDDDDRKAAAKVILRWQAADRPEATRRKEVEVDLEIPDPRYAALSEILSLEARADPAVVEWRARNLPGGLVDHGEIEDLISDILGKGGRSEHGSRTLRYRSSGGVRLAAVRLGSPAADLAAIADRLAASYHWDPLDAVAWVVSGATPAFRPLIVRLLTTDRAATSRIILEVDPRLPRDRVAEVYSAARQHEEIARLVTGSARPLEAKTAELATFLARHERDTWAAMRTRWNQDHKKAWAYGSEWEFARDARRAWKRVVGIPFSKEEREGRRADLAFSAVLGVPLAALPPKAEEEDS